MFISKIDELPSPLTWSKNIGAECPVIREHNLLLYPRSGSKHNINNINNFLLGPEEINSAGILLLPAEDTLK